MHINEIMEQYNQEWLLIEVEKFDENWQPMQGNVLFHSPDDNEVLKEMLKLKGKKIDLSIKYAGQFPEEFAILL